MQENGKTAITVSLNLRQCLQIIFVERNRIFHHIREKRKAANPHHEGTTNGPRLILFFGVKDVCN